MLQCKRRDTFLCESNRTTASTGSASLVDLRLDAAGRRIVPHRRTLRCSTPTIQIASTGRPAATQRHLDQHDGDSHHSNRDRTRNAAVTQLRLDMNNCAGATLLTNGAVTAEGVLKPIGVNVRPWRTRLSPQSGSTTCGAERRRYSATSSANYARRPSTRFVRYSGEPRSSRDAGAMSRATCPTNALRPLTELSRFATTMSDTVPSFRLRGSASTGA